MDHPNICRMFEYFRDENRYYLIIEICSGGELYHKIKKDIRFTEPVAKEYMRQILKTVNYMHNKRIVHRDLKPENFMIDGTDNSLKLIDFGLSKQLAEGEMLNEREGTCYYLAPEVLMRSYDFKADMWSCGVILYTMLSGRPPFNADNDLEIMRMIKTGKYSMRSRIWD